MAQIDWDFLGFALHDVMYSLVTVGGSLVRIVPGAYPLQPWYVSLVSSSPWTLSLIFDHDDTSYVFDLYGLDRFLLSFFRDNPNVNLGSPRFPKS